MISIWALSYSTTGFVLEEQTKHRSVDYFHCSWRDEPLPRINQLQNFSQDLPYDECRNDHEIFRKKGILK